MECPSEVIHGVPRDAALDRIFKIGAQNLGVVNRILQFAANLDATGRLRAGQGHDSEHHFTFRVVFSLGAIRARNQPRTSFHQTVLVLLLSLALLGLISRVDVMAGRRQRNLLRRPGPHDARVDVTQRAALVLDKMPIGVQNRIHLGARKPGEVRETVGRDGTAQFDDIVRPRHMKDTTEFYR